MKIKHLKIRISLKYLRVFQFFSFSVFQWNYILLKCYIENATIVFWLWLEMQTYMQNFRPIDWYYSLLHKRFFCQVIWDLHHFLVSLIWPVTQELRVFEVWFQFWGAIFFSISYQNAYHFFLVWTFLEKLPTWPCQLVSFSSEFYVVRRIFVLEKPIPSANFLFPAKMADGTSSMLLLCVRVCNGSIFIFLKLQTTYKCCCKVQQTCKEERIATTRV